MFQKNQIIYSETQGVCQVTNIVQLSAQRNGKTTQYYVIKPIYDDKVSYIPVENHQVFLREIFSVEEAQAIKEDPKTKESKLLATAVEYVLQNGGILNGSKATGKS